MRVSLKSSIRDLLPKRLQVPAKYWYGWIRGSHEAELKLLDELVRPGDCVIDVGGNRGLYTYKLHKIGATVEVFEPNPKCFDILSSWAANKPGLNAHSVALSNAEGESKLRIPVDFRGEEHDASATIEDTKFLNTRDQLVQLRTLDSYGFKGIRLIKIDVEGHELKVIEGAGSTIHEARPVLIIEIEQRHNSSPIREIFRKVNDLGYRGFFLGKNGLADLEHFDATIHQSMINFNRPKQLYINNFLFLHRDRLANGEYSILME